MSSILQEVSEIKAPEHSRTYIRTLNIELPDHGAFETPPAFKRRVVRHIEDLMKTFGEENLSDKKVIVDKLFEYNSGEQKTVYSCTVGLYESAVKVVADD